MLSPSSSACTFPACNRNTIASLPHLHTVLALSREISRGKLSPTSFQWYRIRRVSRRLVVPEANVKSKTAGVGRERRQKKAREIKTQGEDENNDRLPSSESFVEQASRNDRELQDILGDTLDDPEEMQKRVEDRIRRKQGDMLQPKTGSAIPMKVAFKEFDAIDSYIWMELYNSPSEKDIDIIGSVIRSWYLLGTLGGYNSLNMQLTKVPINQSLSYNENVEEEIVPARFHNVGELEVQNNWGRFWADLGTSDPLALDVLINAFSAMSSDYVGIKELTFGGKQLGNWNEDMTEEDGFKSYKI